MWKIASIFAEFEEVEKVSFSPAGHEVCQIPCFSVGPSRNFDGPSWDRHLRPPSQGCWDGEGAGLQESRESGWLVTAGLTGKRGMRKQGDEDRK